MGLKLGIDLRSRSDAGGQRRTRKTGSSCDSACAAQALTTACTTNTDGGVAVEVGARQRATEALEAAHVGLRRFVSVTRRG
jgi:hypothetical protein